MVTILVAASILWIFIGSLINFHQNRIFGTQLIEETTPFIKPKDKETFLLPSSTRSIILEHNSFSLILLLFISLFSIAGFVISWRTLFFPSFIQALKIAEFPSFRRFRGPPLA